MFRLLMTLMIASTLIGAITVGTFAAFTDTEEDPNNDITAATVDFTINGDSHCVAVSLFPGADIDWDDVEDCVTPVTNIGGDAIDVYLQLVLTPLACDPAPPEDPLISEFCDDGTDITGAEVSLDSASFGATNLIVGGGGQTYAGLVDLAGVAGLLCAKIGTLAASGEIGDALDFSFDGSLDDVGNDAQGDTLKIDLHFAAVLAGEAAPPDCGV
jgi:predicted ribosomally synthesized peptide with SipW-like signal peptide